MMKKPSFMEFSRAEAAALGYVNARRGQFAYRQCRFAGFGQTARVYRFIVNRQCHLFTMPILLFSGPSISDRLDRDNQMFKQLQRFVKDESGAAAIEYGLLTSGISVAIIPGVKEVGSKLVMIFTILQNAL
jgi:Flp pilus assembly pilin Flp